MTNEDWQEIEEKLKSLFLIVKLRCDEYEVSIKLQRINQFKNVIAVYVNGQIKAEWMAKECEESRRFFRKVIKSTMSRKQKDAFKKLPRKLQKEFEINSTYSYYDPSWTSFKSLKKHLIENNNNIGIIRD